MHQRSRATDGALALGW